MMWELVAGFVSSTFVLPVIQQPRWTARTRAWVTFAWCVVAGLGTAYLTGGFAGVHDVRAGVSAVLLVLVSAVGTYQVAKKTGIPAAIERATSPGGRHRAPE